MAFTYTPGGADAISQVRFEVGDKVDVGHLLEDAEITAVVGFVAAVPATPTRDEVFVSAADLADALAVEFAKLVDRKNLSLDVKASQRSKQFKECARRLRQRAGITVAEDGTIAQSVEMSIGGLSIADKLGFEEDSDLVQPSFRRGQDDHPGQVDEDDVHHFRDF